MKKLILMIRQDDNQGCVTLEYCMTNLDETMAETDGWKPTADPQEMAYRQRHQQLLRWMLRANPGDWHVARDRGGISFIYVCVAHDPPPGESEDSADL